MTRRLVLLLVVAVATPALLSGQTSEKAQGRRHYLAFVGTYTTKTASKGIYAFRYDAGSGKLTSLGVAAETQDPSWVLVHPNGKFLYAVEERGNSSMVSAFALDARSGKLTLVNRLPALGEDPCYLSLDRSGKYLLVANYTSGNVVVFPIGTDGKLGPATANVRDEGKLGPNKERQEGPHAHWIEPARDGLSVYVADLGLDKVLHYGFDPKNGTLSAGPAGSERSHALEASAKLTPGTGPRHAVFSSDGQRLYVLGELESTVTIFDLVGSDPFVPALLQKISALPKKFSGRNDAAEIALHPNGKFLYTSNRGNDTIAVFQVSRDGRVHLAANVPTGGKEPRHFAIDPAGNYLFAENQFSDEIVVFRIDLNSGALAPTGETVAVRSPVGLAFLAVE